MINEEFQKYIEDNKLINFENRIILGRDLTKNPESKFLNYLIALYIFSYNGLNVHSKYTRNVLKKYYLNINEHLYIVFNKNSVEYYYMSIGYYLSYYYLCISRFNKSKYYFKYFPDGNKPMYYFLTNKFNHKFDKKYLSRFVFYILCS